MISALTVASSVCCFGAAFLSHKILPVRPITDSDVIRAQSISGTINKLSREEVEREAKTTKDLVDFYLNKTASLEDVLELATKTADIRSAYRVLVEQISKLPEEDEERGRLELLKKAAEEYYRFLVVPPVNASVSVQITKSPDTIQQDIDPGMQGSTNL
jgi:hypothetical protein